MRIDISGLDSHANYPDSKPLMVYQFINGSSLEQFQLLSLGGLYLGDRTLADPYRKWVPRPDLLTYVPPLSSLNETDALTRLEWAVYAGNWGVPLQEPAVYLECLNEEQTSRERCPIDNKITT